MNEAQFVVDTALLTELGERMIGRAYIALAELAKNSYDADATNCMIEFKQDQLIIADDGHGMSEQDFLDNWMRIGTTHKAHAKSSKNLRRSMTGSKGLGRLSVQFLAKEMILESTSEGQRPKTLYVMVDWASIQRGAAIDTFNVLWEPRPYLPKYPNDSPTGTRITLIGLRSDWDSSAIEGLGREIAVLRSPFKRRSLKAHVRSAQDFYVDVDAPLINNAKAAFDSWKDALFANWKACIIGSLQNGRISREAEVSVEFKAGYPEVANKAQTYRETVAFPVRTSESPVADVDSATFKILIFKPERRQPGPLRVAEMRYYLRQFGNVAVYDAGFRLPYYGSLTDKTGQDWLNIALDQGRRLTVSELLPDRLKGGGRYLLDLPAPGRIFGVVDIDTNRERDVAAQVSAGLGDWLVLQPGRDRLAPNAAFEQLRDLVRFGLDYYANRLALRRYQATERRRARDSPSHTFSRVIDLLARHKEDMPRGVYSEVRREVVGASDFIRSEEQALDRRAVLLAPLATAGAAALALNHELARETRLLRQTGARLRRMAKAYPISELREIALEFDAASERMQSIRQLFAPLAEEATADDDRERYRVVAVVEHVVRAMGTLMPGVTFEYSAVSGDLRFPIGAFGEWAAVLQNVLSNSWNAMLEAQRALIRFESGRSGQRGERLHISDTGVGLDVPLGESSVLFHPFERRLKISSENRSVAMGGQGLGLAIVRMIVTNRKADVRFVAPDPGFSTTLKISWKGG